MLKFIRQFIAKRIISYLEKPISNYNSYQFISLEDLETYLEPGDVLLVEGSYRFSTAIKYLTQSTWSHAAFYVGRARGLKNEYGQDAPLIEADVSKGVIAVSLTKYLGFNLRICRPSLISDEDRAKVVDYMCNSFGIEYDIKNITDLARYLLPQPPVPVRWRRKFIALGSGDPTRAICSSLIAQAFQSVNYPILPHIGRSDENKEFFEIRHHSLLTPRDFDLSPYFTIVKPTIEKKVDYKSLNWQSFDEGEEDETNTPPAKRRKGRG